MIARFKFQQVISPESVVKERHKLWALSNGKVMGIGKERECLYILKDCLPSTFNMIQVPDTATEEPAIIVPGYMEFADENDNEDHSELPVGNNEAVHEAGYNEQQIDPSFNISGRPARNSSHDHSLFTKHCGDDIVVLLIYVDDILLTGSSHRLIDDAKQDLHSQFKVKDLGELKYFLRIEILRSQHGILMNQRKYALELISDVGLAGSKPVHTPLEPNVKLTSVEHDKCTGAKDDPLFEDMSRYQKLIGKLIYLTITRPNICFAVQLLSQLMQHPK
uniref:Reverse transcriptase Ty1/copia-type domain-containing protein n=1 Tax=Solanum lycopersicum TaxID=4081 RepID=A0A3Q7H9C8_SOLLC